MNTKEMAKEILDIIYSSSRIVDFEDKQRQYLIKLSRIEHLCRKYEK